MGVEGLRASEPDLNSGYAVEVPCGLGRLPFCLCYNLLIRWVGAM